MTRSWTRPVRLAAAALALALPLSTAGCSSDADSAEDTSTVETTAAPTGAVGTSDATDHASEDVAATTDGPWPSDIPLPDDFTEVSFNDNSTKGMVLISTTGTTTISADEALEFYRDQLSDWEEFNTTESDIDGLMRSIELKKGSQFVIASLTESGDGTNTLQVNFTDGNP